MVDGSLRQFHKKYGLVYGIDEKAEKDNPANNSLVEKIQGKRMVG